MNLPAGFVRDLASAVSVHEILEVTARWISNVLRADRSSVALWDGGDTLRIHAIGGAVLTGNEEIPLHDSLPGTACLTQQVVNIPDITQSTGAESEALQAAGLHSALVSPLVAAGQSLGTMNLGSATLGFFTERDEILLRSIADLIASFLRIHMVAESEAQRARTDELTGMVNRRAVLDDLEQSFGSEQGPPSLLYVDVDGFKAINDTYGHRFGDAVLRTLSLRLQAVLRAGDTFGRLGGDEFLFVIHDDREGDAASKLAARIEAVASQPIVIDDITVEPRISIGAASVAGPGMTAQELLHDADIAMYEAKRGSAPLVTADAQLRARRSRVAVIDRSLEGLFDSDEITFHHQPVRRLDNLEILGTEALVRWEHPELGPIPPPQLIDRLEATGRIDDFTQWSLRTVTQQLIEIRQSVPWFADKAISYNLSRRQLCWDRYVDFHLATIEEAGLRPEDIIVEVTESQSIHADDPAEKHLRQLADAGVLIALDDFGAGHNVLGYMLRFAIHAIKFDRSLTASLNATGTEGEIARRILSGLTSLAADLGIHSLAEGIETEAELDACRSMGIADGQGWHLGRPAPLASFIEQMLAEGPLQPS